MSHSPSQHHCHVHGTPWKGIYGTHVESDIHYGKHFHSTFGMGVLQRGAQRSASGRGVVDAFAGEVMTTNPGEVHDGRPLGVTTRRWRMVYLESGVLESVANLRTLEIVRPVIGDLDLTRALALLFSRLDDWEAATSPRAVEALACEESLTLAFGLLLARHSGGARQRQASAQIERVRDRLGDDLGSPPSLEELANLTGLSRYQVLRRFEQVYGLPPHAWVLQQRAERARGLIKKGVSLANAASASGFADQSHMTRAFGRRYGFTPGAWRRACNNVQD